MVEFDEIVALALAQAVAVEEGARPGRQGAADGEYRRRRRCGAGHTGGFCVPVLSRVGLASAPRAGDPDEGAGEECRERICDPAPRCGSGHTLSTPSPPGAEECYVLSGTLFTCGRQLGPGDFVHADAHTDHGELFTEEGCQVLLVVPPEDYM